ncbi:hypothetical protein BDY19DRAFT_988865 [Irpex rosettiformis]|uniref:Uncharacterized protein n=1 Tax=Irpex rosettiformis TaxID=378272 RepID=A0ACB8UNK9_9APHY|nr:hypothetical protein BDY19DRAFT_988865 [Irpex rosettiformis]
MSRRPSVASLSSIGSGLMKPISLPTVSESRSKTSQSNGSLVAPSRSVSLSANLEAILERNPDSWDPDELFTKHIIAEVKTIQQRLRGDADAKQEELRLMVGERYRDLLQASTSIISIAQSSNHVLSALNEIRRATGSIRPIEGAQASVGGHGDAHLQTLQSLAAHLKLLLDAPEHLWRFMERKLYLHAAWLFLLSRVVHRSLLRAEDDDATWRALDVDISEQFPIVQRQWDTVSQFRSQISHKATMALRENDLTPPEVCAILLTLHLLESRPLPETLATFLAQRTRSLNASLNRTKERASSSSAADASSAQDSITKSRKVLIREIRQRLKVVLDIVVRTVGTSRRIFVQQPESNSALMHEVLRHVQGEDDPSAKSLSSEVALTSQTLLTSLPSSNHFILLPASIRLYKPYIDASPLLASEQSGQIKQKLGDWFQKAVQTIKFAMESWFAELGNMHDLWELRRWCKKWLRSATGLDGREIDQFSATLDLVCRQLAVKIWKFALASTEVAFRKRLVSAVDIIRQNRDISFVDVEPVKYLFKAPSVPSIAHSTTTTTAPSETSFRTFRHSLKQQITARTPLLGDVLSTLENRVKDLRNDFDVTQEELEPASKDLTAQLVQDYGHDAEALCSSLIRTLQDQLDNLGDGSGEYITAIVFLGRLADRLSSSAAFIENLACTDSTAEAFRAKLVQFYNHTLEMWHRQTVSNTIATYWTELSASHSEDGATTGTPSFTGPSTRLLSSLLALSTAIETLGIYMDSERLGSLTRETLRHFIVDVIHELDKSKDRELSAQNSWDLIFLYLLAEGLGPTMQDTRSLLLSRLPWPTETEWPPNARESLSQCLTRSQVLLGLLLPPPAPLTEHSKSSTLLFLGVPTVDTQYQSAFELVQPSARFGLLLVGSSVPL